MQAFNLSHVVNLWRAPKKESSELIGIIDHMYLPIALGDSITAMVNMAARAYELKANGIRVYVVADGGPFNHQFHITRTNYFQHISDLLPVYNSAPSLKSVHVFYRRANFRAATFAAYLQSVPMWPSYTNHLKLKADYFSHHYLNSFFAKNGFLPKVVAPRGYEESTDLFFERYLQGKFIVAINIRQRAFMADHAQLERDSPIAAWYKFLDLARLRYPNVVFVNLGGYTEWDRELARKSNVIIPRILGYNLGNELSILTRADLFMGTSSGFAAMATFSDVPYVITNYEVAVAPRVGLRIGDSYPFASPVQTISWEVETVDLLLKLFEEKYRALR